VIVGDRRVGGGGAAQVPLDHAAQRGTTVGWIVVLFGQRGGLFAQKIVLPVAGVCLRIDQVGFHHPRQAFFDLSVGNVEGGREGACGELGAGMVGK
jgi:hypothetical protein